MMQLTNPFPGALSAQRHSYWITSSNCENMILFSCMKAHLITQYSYSNHHHQHYCFRGRLEITYGSNFEPLLFDEIL